MTTRESPATIDPWVRIGVSIGVVPLVVLLLHLPAGLVYRAVSLDEAAVVSAAIWAASTAVLLAGYAVLATWRRQGVSLVAWWSIAVIGIVSAAEFVVNVIALLAPLAFGDPFAQFVERLIDPRFWAVVSWMPVAAYISAVAIVRYRRARPRRAALIVVTLVVPLVLGALLAVVVGTTPL